LYTDWTDFADEHGFFQKNKNSVFIRVPQARQIRVLLLIKKLKNLLYDVGILF